LAAWIRHASRARNVAIRGERRKGEEYMGTYLGVWDSGGKLPVIPDNVSGPKVRFRLKMGPCPIS